MKNIHKYGLLQRIRFAGWTLTEGQHRPKAGKKKKTREAGLFFLVTIIVVITLNLIRKITLNMRCSVPCCEVQHFFFWLSMERRWAIRTLNLKEVSYESGTLHNHCGDNLEPNSKDNSEYSVLCSLLRGSTFFFLALHGKALGYKNFEFKRSQL